MLVYLGLLHLCLSLKLHFYNIFFILDNNAELYIRTKIPKKGTFISNQAIRPYSLIVSNNRYFLRKLRYMVLFHLDVF